MRAHLFLLFALLISLSYSQNKIYRTDELDKILTKNSDAVFQLDELEVSVEARNFMRARTKQIVTVLNNAGNKSIRWYTFYDKGDKIEHLEAVIYDSNGNEIKKIKQKDFRDISAVPGGTLYSDSRLKYLQYTPAFYPYTVEYTCVYSTQNTAFLPPWHFLGDYNASVLNSRYKLSVKPGLSFKHREYNFEGFQITKNQTEHSLEYKAVNLPSIKKEELAPGLNEIAPHIRVAMDEFHLEGVDGSASDWKIFGKWMYDKLLAGRDIIDPQTASMIESMTKDAQDPLEKIKIIYDYVQNNTRYISVQLGIGGWEPISAAEVDRVKYGDCKGLVNYTRALLKSQGIKSYYSVVWAGPKKKDIEPEFACMQGNHVILNVPLEGEDIWLECTSQKIPFGFLGDFTDDRQVLVVKPEGGFIKRTRAYLNKDNLKFTRAIVEISEEGDLKADVHIENKGIEYDKKMALVSMTDREKDDYYKEYWSNQNRLAINEIEIEENKENVVLVEKVKLNIPKYSDQVGQEIIFRVNPLDVNNLLPARTRVRNFGFELQRGFYHESENTIKLPEGFDVRNIPDVIAISNKYGSFRMEINQQGDNELLYKKSLWMKEGDYEKEEYNNFRDFCRTVTKYDNYKLLLTKNTN